MEAKAPPAAEAAPEAKIPRKKEGEGRPKDLKEQRFLNRELSWLEFNRRVLHQALDHSLPLLERVRFLSIFQSNLDEFFMKRVWGLKQQKDEGLPTRTPSGLSPTQQLRAIRGVVLPMLKEQARVFTQELKPALKENQIHLLSWSRLTAAELAEAKAYFENNVFPVLTPLAVDPGHPFPFISNLSTSLGVVLSHPEAPEEKLFARVKIPELLPPLIRLQAKDDGKQYRFVTLLDMIRHNLQNLFPNMTLLSVTSFRLTRNADVERDEEDAEDLLELIEKEVRQRRFERPVRLEHEPGSDPWTLEFIKQELELETEDIYEMPAEISYRALDPISELPLPHLRFKPWTPLIPPSLADAQTDLFAIIRRDDILVHQPFESFNATVERFIQNAANDPKVLAIKMAVYRTSEESPFIRALIRAAEQGKQVGCLVELKARFDEERNINWANQLEQTGVHVVYGVVGLKTHCKVALVVRQDPDGIRSYVHIGTGNYHSQTAKLYTDLGLFTCKPEFAQDVVELFHYLTGRSLKREYRKLLVAPVNMRARFIELIQRECQHQQAGRPARIIAKMNSLEDVELIEALYAASQAGLSIDLLVRGFCCLRPGVPGLSENIRVRSIIGRFLEHSRIFYFRNGAQAELDGEFFIGSADWMYRNLNNRVEAIVPIEDRGLRERCYEILQVCLQDRRQAWSLHPDGSYLRLEPGEDDQPLARSGTHQALMELTRARLEKHTRGI